MPEGLPWPHSLRAMATNISVTSDDTEEHRLNPTDTTETHPVPNLHELALHDKRPLAHGGGLEALDNPNDIDIASM